MTPSTRACLTVLPALAGVSMCSAQVSGPAASPAAPIAGPALMAISALSLLLAVLALFTRPSKGRLKALRQEFAKEHGSVVAEVKGLTDRLNVARKMYRSVRADIEHVEQRIAVVEAALGHRPQVSPPARSAEPIDEPDCLPSGPPTEPSAPALVAQPPSMTALETAPVAFDDWLREAADTGRTAATSVLRNLIHAPANVEASLRSGAENQIQSLLGNLDLALYGRVRPEDLPMPDAEERALQIEQRQREWVDTLRSRGLARIIADAGSPFVDGETEDSGEAPSPTTDPSKEGRIAGVKPGNGGYQLHGRILSVTKARKYVYQPTDR